MGECRLVRFHRNHHVYDGGVVGTISCVMDGRQAGVLRWRGDEAGLMKCSDEAGLMKCGEN
jgi:hypothetical protein